MNLDFHVNKLCSKAGNTCHGLDRMCKYMFITKKRIPTQNCGFLLAFLSGFFIVKS